MRLWPELDRRSRPSGCAPPRTAASASMERSPAARGRAVPGGIDSDFPRSTRGSVLPMNLEDRAAITDLIAMHGHYVDTGQLDRLSEILADDVTYDTTDLGGNVIVGREELRSRHRPR